MTNADKIRAMTDDELAGFFKKEGYCPSGREQSDEICHKFGGRCIKCWLDWLKAEAEDV